MHPFINCDCDVLGDCAPGENGAHGTNGDIECLTDESETAVFPTPAQRTALIAAAPPEAAAFLRGLELTGVPLP